MRALGSEANLLGLLFLQALALVSGLTVNQNLLDAKNNIKSLALLTRDDTDTDWEKCSPPTNPSLQERRSVQQYGSLGRRFEASDSLSHNTTNATTSHLLQPVMTLPESSDAQSMNAFMRSEMDTSTPIVWERNSKNDQNTAVYQLFAGKAVSAGMSGLCGCTGLLIVSRQGWLLAHYWESSSFDPDSKWGYKTAEEALEKQVLQRLRGYDTKAHPALKPRVGAFSDASVRAFLVVPSETFKKDTAGYRDAWDKIKATVGKSVPELDPTTHADRWQEYVYQRRNVRSRLLRDTAAGHVLVKYDPDHPEKSKTNKLTVWVEQQQLYDDEWK